MSIATSSSTSSRSRPIYSCIRCSDRKVKCDRQQPCSGCMKHSAECIFRPAYTPRKRQKRARGGSLNDRLEHYEALLKEQGIDASALPDTPRSRQRLGQNIDGTEYPLQLPTPASVVSEPEGCITKTQLLYDHGHTKFVDK